MKKDGKHRKNVQNPAKRLFSQGFVIKWQRIIVKYMI